ncbi:ABC transporter ATP-binding protein [Variovorax sp. OV700]|uniref:ABC transporter ATP-binding protein n=1 Tax=Variovorax sp. OV700 TaxID=1882826 RepID=UPI00088B1E2B|nr:ABC transporter ATP-binding protein [Variovorax sp. OV700]SDH85844.1 amino acid/amide ABC transporter ATP-binding protein 1, HAAT family [Variovorax sp. OV700]
MLNVEKLSVFYGGVKALNELSMRLEPSRIYGLIGPNGAGKSTAINAISGAIRPTAGSIRLRDRDLTAQVAHERARAGIGRTFQNLALFQSMTVYENIACGALHARGAAGRGDAATAVDRLIEEFGLEAVRDRHTKALPLGIRKRVELARAFASNPSVLLLDEPAAGLTPEDMEDLKRRVQGLRDAGGIALIVEHHMGLVMSLCEHLYVLEFGKLIASGSPQQVVADPLVQAAYFGGDDEIE